MTGKVHVHKGMRVYHRKDGALSIHGRKHSRYTPSLDRKRKAKTVLKGKRRKYYPHTGDSKNRRIKEKAGRLQQENEGKRPCLMRL